MKRSETRGEKAVRIAEQHIIQTAIVYTRATRPRSMELIAECIAKLDAEVAALKAARQTLGVERRAATRAGRRS